MSKIKKIAITGVIGSGKSTVCKYLSSQQYKVIDCDKIVHELYEIDKKLILEIQSLFQENILFNQKIDRKKLKSLLFLDIERQTKVENLVFKRVKEILAYKINQLDDKVVFVEVQLLVKSGLENFFDEIWQITVADDILVHRLKENRNMSIEQIRTILDAQQQEKNIVHSQIFQIENNQTLEILKLKIEERLRKGL